MENVMQTLRNIALIGVGAFRNHCINVFLPILTVIYTNGI